MRTFSVKNFDRFQHYKDRSPPWIKLYNELLDDYEFGLLPDATKMHLVAIWLLASRSENKIPFDPKWVGNRINATDAVNLQLLADNGFIVLDQDVHITEQVASKTIAECLTREREEGETEERQIGGGVETRAREPSKSMISEDAFEITSEILKSMGKSQHDPIAVGSPYIVQHWLSGGISRDAIICGVEKAMIHKKHDPPSTFKYFEKAVLRAAAEMNRPLPKVQVLEAETLTVTNHAKPKNGIIQAADDLCERIASFDGPPGGIDKLRSAEGEAPPRLLSHR